MVTTTTSGFGELLRQHRHDAGLTQEQLAERAGISARTISDLERGVFQTAKTGTAHRLGDAFGLVDDERMTFEASARGEGYWQPGASAGEQLFAGVLPAPPTEFIGRTAEIEAAGQLFQLDEVRLLTLTGTGGTGKTRLAIEVARAAADRFADGVFFVPLAPIGDWRLLISAVAGTLGLRESGSRSLDQMVRSYLKKREILLVLDNFEHILPAAITVGELLAGCPDLTILLTSRAALHLSGEQVFPVPPMPVPTPGDMLAPSTVDRHDATALFVRRAGAADPGFRVTLENVPHILEICSRLDGLPLAIELAAARITLLPPAALLQRLDHRLPLLVDGPRDAPMRQQTLWNTIDWSFQLLSSKEQSVFAQLSVFAGGCTFEMAETVCGGEDAGVLASLGRLMDSSLLLRAGEEEPRVVMLETIREYAGERLAGMEKLESTEQRYAEAFLELAEEGKRELAGPRQVTWLARLETEHDNLRAALTWLCGRGDGSLGLRLAIALAPFWSIRCHWEEGCRWLEAMLASVLEAEPVLIAQASSDLGWLATCRSQFDRAAELLDRSAMQWRSLENAVGTAQVLERLGDLHLRTGKYREATAHFQESLRLSRDGGDIGIRARALGSLSAVEGARGEYERAMRLSEEVLALYRETGQTSGISSALYCLANSESSIGYYDRAEDHLAEALTLVRQLGDSCQSGRCLHNLGFNAMCRGNLQRAQDLYLESLELQVASQQTETAELSLSDLGEIARLRGDLSGAAGYLREALLLAQRNESKESWHIALALEHLARAAGSAGLIDSAVRLWGAVASIRGPSGILPDPVERRDQESAMLRAREDLDDVGWARAWQDGASMSPDEAVEFGLRTTAAMRAEQMSASIC